jgi:hypothetical protein
VPEQVEARIAQKMVRPMDGDPLSIERGVRQRLADKILDNMAGLWLLVPEHLRLGTWDLLRSWTRQPTERIEPRRRAIGPRSGPVQQQAARGRA